MQANKQKSIGAYAALSEAIQAFMKQDAPAFLCSKRLVYEVPTKRDALFIVVKNVYSILNTAENWWKRQRIKFGLKLLFIEAHKAAVISLTCIYTEQQRHDVNMHTSAMI